MTTTTGPPEPVPVQKKGVTLAKRFGTEGPAREAAERVWVIRRGLENLHETVALLKAAYTSGDWSHLGYATWQEYTASEFGEAAFPALKKAQRESLVAALHDTMSVRAIAAVLGVSKSLVAKDLGDQEPPAVHKVDTSPPQLAAVHKVDTSPGSPGEAADASPQVSAPQPAKPKLSVVKGLDGKSHPASKPAAHHPTPAQQKAKEDLAWHPMQGYAWKAADRARKLLKEVPLGKVTDPFLLAQLEDLLDGLEDEAYVRLLQVRELLGKDTEGNPLPEKDSTPSPLAE